MAIPITIPRLGWNMEEGTFAGWLKPDGAAIQAGEPLFSLESEKATEDIECLDAGILRIAPEGPKVGDVLAVGVVIAYLVKEGEAAPFEAAPAETIATVAPPVAAAPSEYRAADDVEPAEENGHQSPRERLAASPRARRAATELGVDWQSLEGSGRTGRIRERDVLAAAAAESARPVAAPAGVPVGGNAIRRTIAGRMLASHLSTAPVTLTTTADATNLVNLRGQFKQAAPAGNGFVPSYTDFLVKLTAVALEQHPRLTTCRSDEGTIIPERIHIGIAVDSESGLLVPVLRDVPSLGLRQLSAQSGDLIDRARRRRLSAEEMQGGVFTVTSLGGFGIDAFTPIINLPQCAILGVGRIRRKPVAHGDQIVLRDELSLSLTFDHCIIDGAPAARFLQTLTLLIENPGPWLMP